VQAILKADAEMKAEQAKMAPPPEQGQFAAPEQMPGLGGPPPTPPNMPPEMAAAMAGGQSPEAAMAPPAGPSAAPMGQGGPEQGQNTLRELMSALSQQPPVPQ